MTKSQFRILMILTVVAGFLGGGLSNLLLRGTPALAQGGVQGVVQAKQFQVVDDQGRVLVLLAADDKGYGGVFVKDTAGTNRAHLGFGGDDPGLWIDDAKGTNRVQLGGASNSLFLSNAAGKTNVTLGYDVKGYPGLFMNDNSGTRRASIGFAGDDAGCWLYDAAGKATWQAPEAGAAATTGTTGGGEGGGGDAGGAVNHIGK